MKTIMKSILVIILLLTASSFTTSTIDKIVVKESSITWKGKKIIGSHTGTIILKEGFLEMEGDEIIGGSFIVDMTTITDTDMEGEGKAKLERHLKSSDFFAVDYYPTADLIIKNAVKKGNLYHTTGELTIKGITNPITFDLEMGATGARASLKIDRIKYDIHYGSGNFTDKLADNTISNYFELDVTLKF